MCTLFSCSPLLTSSASQRSGAGTVVPKVAKLAAVGSSQKSADVGACAVATCGAGTAPEMKGLTY